MKRKGFVFRVLSIFGVPYGESKRVAARAADLLQDASRSSAQRILAEAQAKVGKPVNTVSDWLKKLDDDNKSNDCPLNTEPFLDLAAYLKSLPQSDNPPTVFKSLLASAKRIVGAQNVITGMLKQQARK